MVKEGREYRAMVMTARAAEPDTDNFIVTGYATTFNQPYLLYDFGNYRVMEQIDSSAFDECDMKDTVMQYDHNGRVYARTRNKTLSLKVDAHGLFIEADLGGTEEGRKLYSEIAGGYTDRMSFGFVVGEDKREYTDDHENRVETCLRTITKISKLYDVSAVSIPANDNTEISARSFSEGVFAEAQAERLERENRERQKQKIRILMEVNHGH